MIARYDLANLANGQALATGEQIGARRRSVIESAVRQPPQNNGKQKRTNKGGDPTNPLIRYQLVRLKM